MDNSNRGKILIVEDDPGTAALHRRSLERRGFTAVSAATSHDAMQLVHGGDLDLILLDYRLSDGTTGLEFCEALKSAGNSVPVVIVTGFSREQTAVEALRAGVRDYVTKSSDYLDYLPEAVDRILRQVDVERRLLNSESRLAAANEKMEAVGTLAGGIAHEFNNLLQAIQGYATFAIKSLPVNEQPYQDLQQLLKVVGQASTLTQQILGIAQRQSLKLAEVDLNQVVGDLVTRLRPLFGSQINIAFASDHEIGTVLADSDQLQQALMNLCVNARDAMQQGGNLLLRTERRAMAVVSRPTRSELKPGNYVVVTVRDDGAGMARHVKDRIFEPFFTTKEVGKGRGLGLSMAYGIVQQHAGTIDVRSEPGRGTTFEIFLPSSEQAAEPESLSDVTMSSCWPRIVQLPIAAVAPLNSAALNGIKEPVS